MSTTEPAAAKSADTAATKTHAMLVRGRIYILGEVEFNVDVPVPVTPEQIAHLRRHAVDLVSLEGESEFQRRAKFKFMTAADAEIQRLKNVSEGAPDDSLTVPDIDAEEDEPPPPRSRYRGNR